MNMAWNRRPPLFASSGGVFVMAIWERRTESSPEFQFNPREIDFVKVRSVKANLDEVCTAFDWLLKYEERVHIMMVE